MRTQITIAALLLTLCASAQAGEWNMGAGPLVQDVTTPGGEHLRVTVESMDKVARRADVVADDARQTTFGELSVGEHFFLGHSDDSWEIGPRWEVLAPREEGDRNGCRCIEHGHPMFGETFPDVEGGWPVTRLPNPEEMDVPSRFLERADDGGRTKVSQCNCAETGICICDPELCRCRDCPEHGDRAVEQSGETCDCAETGICTCDPRRCECEDCPEHGDRSVIGGWLDDYTQEGREVLLFSRADCRYCVPVERELVRSGLNVRVVKYDTRERRDRADFFGVRVTPSVRFLEDGTWYKSLNLEGSGDITAEAVGDWLDGTTPTPARRIVRQAVTQPQPVIYSEPSYTTGFSQPSFSQPSFMRPMRSGFGGFRGGCVSGRCGR